MTADRLYTEDSIDLLEAADPRQVLEEHSDEAVIARAVETAQGILAAAGYDMSLPPNLLLGPTKRRCWEHHFAARVLYHARQMDRAVQGGRVLDVRKHAMHFATWLERAKHTEAWGAQVLKHRNIRGRPPVYDEAKIRAIADAHRMPDGEISAAGRQRLEAIGVSERHLRRLLGRI